MDETTLNYYATHAVEVANRYENADCALSNIFDESFIPGSRILDVGCGSGRDLAVLAKKGFDVFGVDPVTEFVSIAQKKHPNLSGRVKFGQLPSLGNPFNCRFDGLLCSAVLMHIDELALEYSIEAFKAILKPYGRALISIPLARNDIDIHDRDENGRLFKRYSSSHLKKVLERHSFKLIKEWENVDTLKRIGFFLDYTVIRT